MVGAALESSLEAAWPMTACARSRQDSSRRISRSKSQLSRRCSATLASVFATARREASTQALIDLDLEIRGALARPLSPALQLDVRRLSARLREIDPH